MTLDSTTSKVQYTQAGSTTAWPVPFKFLDEDDLVVITTVGSTDTTLVRDTDYTVTGAGDDSGGEVTISPALAVGTKLTIYRLMELVQPTHLSTAGGWYPPVHETVFDRLTMMIQQGQEQIDRSLKIPVTADEDEAEDVIQSIYDARDDALAAVAEALDAIAAAQGAAGQIGVLYWLGVLEAGDDIITLPWEYDVAAKNVSVFLDGVKQTRDTLTFVDSTHVQIGAAVAAETKYEVLSLVMNSESALTEILTQAIEAKDDAEDAAETAQEAAQDAADAFSGAIDVPLGTLIWLTGTVAPAGYVAASGQLLSRAAYPDFWAWVQTSGNLSASDAAWTEGKYSPGDGTTTFRVPDMRDGFVRGLAATGRTIGSTQAGQVQAHKHVVPYGNLADTYFGRTDNAAKRGEAESDANNYWLHTNDGTDYDGAVNASGVIGEETRPENIAYSPFIKAFTSVSNPSVFQVANLEGAVQDLGTISGNVTIDTDLGDATFTVGGALSLSISGGFVVGYGRTVAFYITNGGTNVTWPASVLWPSGSAPALSAAGTDLVVLYTADGGTTWLGVAARDFS